MEQGSTSFIRRRLTRGRMLGFLDEMSSSPDIVSTTLLAPSGASRDDLALLGWQGLPPSAAGGGAGLALFSGTGVRMAVAPPFPLRGPDGGLLKYPVALEGLHVGPLRWALTDRHVVAILLLRLGFYAVGVAEDGSLCDSKTGSRYVHSRHRAGGQSQRRFERNREQWMTRLYDEVCGVSEARCEPYRSSLDTLALGGDRHVLDGFFKRCPYMADLRDRLRTVRVPVERPGLKTLQQACEEVWSTDVWTAEAAALRNRTRG